MDAFAYHHGLNKCTLHGRLKRGETLDEAIQPRGPTNSQPIKHNGETFESKAALARNLNINECTLSARLNTGETINDIIKNYRGSHIKWTEEFAKNLVVEIYKKFNDGQPCSLHRSDVKEYLSENKLSTLNVKVTAYWGRKDKLDLELGFDVRIRSEHNKLKQDQVIDDFKSTWSDPDKKFIKFLNDTGFVDYPWGYSEVKYTKNHKKVKIFCNIHKDFFYQTPAMHKDGRCGCKKCYSAYKSWYLTADIDEKLKLAAKVHDNKYIYNIEKTKKEYKNFRSPIYYKCPDHLFLGELSTSVQNHTGSQSQGCKLCGKIKAAKSCRHSHEQNMQALIGVHEEGHYDYSYIKEDDYETKTDEVRIFCNKLFNNGEPHGFFNQSLSMHQAGHGCNKCNTLQYSKAVKLIDKFLSDHNINFEKEKRFDECRHKNPLPFDYFLPELNILIEYDGEQHFKPMRWSKMGNKAIGKKIAEQKLKETQLRDKIKTKWAKASPYTLHRITYKENIEDKINEIIEDSGL